MSARVPAPDERNEEERRRLERLRALRVLDTEAEPLFDSLAALASQVCGTPVALLSLIDADRQWFKANVGLPGVAQTPREIAFCHHAIRGRDALMEVSDATRDARFSHNPLVTGEPGIRFYAGAPLVMSSGERLGTLCVIDRQPRRLTQEQAAVLVKLAQGAVQALEMRQRLAERSAELHAILDAQSEMVAQATPDGRLIYVNPAYARQFGLEVEAVVGSNLFDYVLEPDRPLVRERIRHVLASGESLTSENRMQLPDGEECWISWTNARQQDAAGRPLLHSTGRDVTARVRAERALRRSQALLARTGRVAGVGGWEMNLATGEVAWTEETRRLHEVPADFQPTLDSVLAFYEPASRAAIAAAVERALHDGAPWDLELQLRTALGRPLWARAVGEVELEDGRPARLFGTFQDITELHAVQAEKDRQAATVRSVANAIPSTVAVVDADGRYAFVNRAFEAAVGRPAAELLGRTAREVLGQAEFERRRPWIQRVRAGEQVRFELEDAGDEGRRYTALDYIPLRTPAGELDGFVVVGQDVTAQRVEASRLQWLSQSDPLTRLLNRAGFEQRLRNLLDEQSAESLAVLYIDLDRFKPVNDRHGHAAGDEVLKSVALRLVRLVRPSDTVARLGGDEFAMVLPGMQELAQAQRVAQAIVDAMRQPFELAGGTEVRIGASVGGALGPATRGNWNALLRRADEMLYEAKGAGRDRAMVTAWRDADAAPA
ncbi:MAG: diguanylate cyclase [Proteobacteria bacterium]|nr:diguanylate cyclase [Pseudomonadota bacterium]